MKGAQFFFLCVALLALPACQGRYDLAPVSELSTSPLSTVHTVRAGETLYAIAFHYDTDYRTLASFNHLSPPYALHVGQRLAVKGLVRKPLGLPVPAKTPARLAVIYSSVQHKPSLSGWLWPANGHVTATFNPNQGKKGIDIASKKGEKVYAARAGTVAYAGSGLAGYGNLIIIKHGNAYLTAYGFNAKNLVREGQYVTSGQVIADVGVVDHKYYGVHFEIRKAGRPINPLIYLKQYR